MLSEAAWAGNPPDVTRAAAAVAVPSFCGTRDSHLLRERPSVDGSNSDNDRELFSFAPSHSNPSGDFADNFVSIPDGDNFKNWECTLADADDDADDDADETDNDGGWNALAKYDKQHTTIVVETKKLADIIIFGL